MFQYIVRVRDKTYVWGSNDLGVSLSSSVLLVINNDAFGETVEIASEDLTGASKSLGTLLPGQCWTLELNGLRGVTASCDTDTTLACAILRNG